MIISVVSYETIIVYKFVFQKIWRVSFIQKRKEKEELDRFRYSSGGFWKITRLGLCSRVVVWQHLLLTLFFFLCHMSLPKCLNLCQKKKNRRVKLKTNTGLWTGGVSELCCNWPLWSFRPRLNPVTAFGLIRLFNDIYNNLSSAVETVKQLVLLSFFIYSGLRLSAHRWFEALFSWPKLWTMRFLGPFLQLL